MLCGQLRKILHSYHLSVSWGVIWRLDITIGFYIAKLDEIGYQVCFSSCRDWYLTKQNPEFQNPAIGGVWENCIFLFLPSPPLAQCYMHLWFRWKAPQMTLKFFPWVYYMIICYVGSAWGHSGTHGGPKMAQNSTKKAENVSKSPEWLKMALHDARWPKWP